MIEKQLDYINMHSMPRNFLKEDHLEVEVLPLGPNMNERWQNRVKYKKPIYNFVDFERIVVMSSSSAVMTVSKTFELPFIKFYNKIMLSSVEIAESNIDIKAMKYFEVNKTFVDQENTLFLRLIKYATKNCLTYFCMEQFRDIRKSFTLLQRFAEKKDFQINGIILNQKYSFLRNLGFFNVFCSNDCEIDTMYLLSNRQDLGRIIKKHDLDCVKDINELTELFSEEIGMFIDKKYVMKIKIDDGFESSLKHSVNNKIKFIKGL
jgi:hypothetical protein